MGFKDVIGKIASPFVKVKDGVQDGVGMVKIAHDAEDLLNVARELGLHKEWYKSRTMWFNLIAAVVELLQHVGGLHVVPDEYVAGALLVGNIILRGLSVGTISKDQAIAIANAALEAAPKPTKPEEGK